MRGRGRRRVGEGGLMARGRFSLFRGGVVFSFFLSLSKRGNAGGGSFVLPSLFSFCLSLFLSHCFWFTLFPYPFPFPQQKVQKKKKKPKNPPKKNLKKKKTFLRSKGDGWMGSSRRIIIDYENECGEECEFHSSFCLLLAYQSDLFIISNSNSRAFFFFFFFFFKKKKNFFRKSLEKKLMERNVMDGRVS